MKIARIHTIPASFSHILDQVCYLQEQGTVVDLICSPDGQYDKKIEEVTGKKIIPLNIAREIDIKSDLKSVCELYKLFKKENYDIIHSSTPKAGLLVAIAALLAGQPKRIHTFTGQRWAHMTGFKRLFFKLIDTFIINSNTLCFTDAPSQRDFLASQLKIVDSKLKVIKPGSYGGINPTRFLKLTQNEKSKLRQELGIKENDFVFLFLGRVNNDKGINELLAAFKMIAAKRNDVVLLVVGPYEDTLDGLHLVTKNELEQHPQIKRIGFTNNPFQYYSIADLNCLASYREGFGTVVLEAALYSLPTVGTKIVGLVDAIEEGKTGLLVPFKDIGSLQMAMESLLEDRNRLKWMGKMALERAEKDFDFKLLSGQLLEVYKSM